MFAQEGGLLLASTPFVAALGLQYLLVLFPEILLDHNLLGLLHPLHFVYQILHGVFFHVALPVLFGFRSS